MSTKIEIKIEQLTGQSPGSLIKSKSYCIQSSLLFNKWYCIIPHKTMLAGKKKIVENGHINAIKEDSENIDFVMAGILLVFM